MKAEVIELIVKVIQVLQINMRWMTWNLFLAFIPLVLSTWLFRGRQKPSLVWWPVFLVFYAFLPNAPYLLTDVIHLIDDIRNIPSIWVITLILIPTYLLVILAGFQAYVISLINLGYYLHRIRRSSWIMPVELITHIINAIGIYWGRFLRFNSWDLVTQPDTILTKGIEELLGKQPLVIILISFIILWGLYSLVKQITLGIIYRQERKVSTQDNIQIRRL